MMDSTILAALSDYVYWWQIPLFLLVIVLIVFWVIYRRRQM